MTDALSLTLGALADPTRRAILARLSQGKASVKELAAPHQISLAAVSRHIKVLETAGLVTRTKNAQWRYCQLEAAPMRDVVKWLDLYRRYWDDSLDQLSEYLTDLQSGDKSRPQ